MIAKLSFLKYNIYCTFLAFVSDKHCGIVKFQRQGQILNRSQVFGANLMREKSIFATMPIRWQGGWVSWILLDTMHNTHNITCHNTLHCIVEQVQKRDGGLAGNY